jgi:hypothetical protein
LPQLASNTVAYSTDVFHSTDESADARVQEIIAANDFSATGKGSDGKAIEHPDAGHKLAARASDHRLARVQ